MIGYRRDSCQTCHGLSDERVKHRSGRARRSAKRVPLRADATGRTTFRFADWHAQAVYFADLAGNMLELIARHTLPSTLAEPFSAASLVAISEIGLVVVDVPATVARLQADLDLRPYHGSSLTFTAVGDARGLFIVVQRSRAWYPDETVPAVPVPLLVDRSDETGAPRQLTEPLYAVTR
jgi:catechol-2,3-dioxygenase